MVNWKSCVNDLDWFGNIGDWLKPITDQNDCSNRWIWKVLERYEEQHIDMQR